MRRPKSQAAAQHIKKIDDHRIGFGDFPAEVRNRVYELALTRSRNLRLCNVHDLRKEYETRMVLNSTRVFPSILRTCRKVHEEASSVLYGDNTFQLETCLDFVIFLRAIGASVRRVRSVEVMHAVWIRNFSRTRIRQRDLTTLRKAKGLCRFVIAPYSGGRDERPIREIRRVLSEIRDEQSADGKEEVLQIIETRSGRRSM
ncbi:hypothetical protein PRZ48_011584 [Zasmidium cellare]|uniref:2EXR domain-containing protein n=1 Tax=Zasmidium cellare TaxID=395010 RepID=A0ABR0E6S3_ZASCE|nr:hypothetical protein PRZ48_011584 [Zasmidium cellare]